MVRRVAILSDQASPLAPPGGIECGGHGAYVAHLARELAQLGYLVDIFTRRDALMHAQVVQWRANIRVVNVPAGPAHFIPRQQMLQYMDAFASFVVRYARRQDAVYDVVHANFFMSGMVAQHIKRALGIPFVITFHGLGHVCRMAQGTVDVFPPVRLHIEHSLMREADRIIAQCAQERQDMEQLYGAPSARIDTVPRGFDPQELWPVPVRLARQKLSLPLSRFIVLHLGRKGLDTAIESLALLRRRHGVDAMLLVVGSEGEPGEPGEPGSTRDTPELARLRTLARQHGVSDLIQFMGRQSRPELRYFYSAADVFVTAPGYESIGIAPVEAMACARPVIVATGGGIKSSVIDGKTGFLVPARDPQALADKLALLHAHPELAGNMGDEGMRRAFQHFSWRSVAQQTAAVYQAAVSNAVFPSQLSQ